MITKLRARLLLIFMCSVVAVLLCVLGAVNLINYTGVLERADRLVGMLRDGGGNIPPQPGQHMSPETPFSTRYFCVTLSSEGAVLQVDIERIASVTEEQAIAYAQALLLKGKAQGFCEHFRYARASANGETTYYFVDCSTELGNFYRVLWISLAAGVAGVLVVFLLSLVLSERWTRRLAEGERRQKQFITDAGHELRTPLSVIAANNEVIRLHSGESEWTNAIDEQVKRLSTLTDRLILLARMEEQHAWPFEVFCLSEAVQQSVHTLSVVAAAHGRTFKCDIRDGLMCRGNPAMIRELCDILLENAVKYSSEEEIGISLTMVHARTVLAVTNHSDSTKNGPLDELFQSFARGDASRSRATGGHGIGLSIVRAIAEAHRAQVRGECREGVVTFFVSFPPLRR